MDEAVGKVWTSYLLYKYDVCYELIERAYIEVEKAEEHGVTEEELHGYREKLRICGIRLRKGNPRGSQRLNEVVDWFDFECVRLKTTIPFTEVGYQTYLKFAESMRCKITQALHYGGSYRYLRRYTHAIDTWLCKYHNNVLNKNLLMEYHGLNQEEKNLFRKLREQLSIDD